MPANQCDHDHHRGQHGAHLRVDALLGTAWAWDDDDEHEAGMSPRAREHERDPGPGAR